MEKEDKNLNEKHKKNIKTFYIALAIILPLLTLGITFGLVFGFSTTKTLSIFLSQNGSISMISEGKEIKPVNGKYPLPTNKSFDIIITPNEGYSIASIVLDGEEIEITAEAGKSQILTIEKFSENQELKIIFGVEPF